MTTSPQTRILTSAASVDSVAAEVPHAEIVQQLERILADPVLEKSHRLSTFLRFVVEGWLAGHADRLKESVIGVEVFERGASYNPQEEPIVRIMAGRLRAKLAEYYQGSGAGDPILIDLPKGGYVPRASRHPSSNPRPLEASKRKHAPVCVGRTAELNSLDSAFSTMVAEAGSIVIVSGNAGIGKTTLVEDFLATVADRGMRTWVVRGRGSERLFTTDAFVPVFECLESLLGGEGGPEAKRLVEANAPSWYQQIARASMRTEESAGKGVDQSRDRMRREFVALFTQLAQIRPVILFLEDMHWADESTCDLLAYFASRLSRLRVLIILTSRRTELLAVPQSPFLKTKLELESCGTPMEISLSSLTEDDVRRFLDLQFPGHQFPGELARVVHQRTEGTPLFMNEMARFLRDRRMVSQEQGIWHLTQPVGDVRTLVPTRIRSMIGLKVDLFEEGDRELLLCAAVQGLEFDSAVAAKVLGRDPVLVEERLQALEEETNFVRAVSEREFPNHTFSLRYRFVHVLYQNALGDSMAPSRRSAHSLAIARALVEFHGDASRAIAADLALLFEGGRDPVGASKYFLQAARNAARVFAYPEAAALCGRGLRSLLTLPESSQRDAQELRFSMILGMALMTTRGYGAPEVEPVHARSRSLSLKLGDNRRLLSALWCQHTYLNNAGELVQALAVAQEMRRVADQVGDTLAICEALHAFGTTLAYMGRMPEARQALERIFQLYPVDNHVFQGGLYVMDPCVTSLCMLARVTTFLGHLDQALKLTFHSMSLATRLEHPPSLAYAILWVGWVRLTRGEYNECLHHIELSMRMSREHDLALFLEWGRLIRGSALTHKGRSTEGLADIRTSIERQRKMGSLLESGYMMTLLAEALACAGSWEEALSLCDEALELGQRSEGRCYESETLRIRGEALAQSPDRAAEAPEHFRRAIRSASDAECRLLELRAAISLRRLGRRSVGTDGVAELRCALDWFTEGLDTPYLREGRLLLGA